MPQRKRLSDESSDRETEKVDLRKAKPVDEVSGIVAHCIKGVRRLSTGASNACIVEEDHMPVSSESICDHGIPVVHPATEMLHE
jgi:hypothetical protein